MADYLESQVVEPEDGLDVSVDTEAMRDAFPEYFIEQKPDYDWNKEDNILAYIQFESFPEEIFRKFIEYKKIEIKRQRYYNPGGENKPYQIADDVIIKEKDEDEYGREEFHRMLWAGGLVLEEINWDAEKRENQTALIEVVKSPDDCRIWLRARGSHENRKKKLLTDVFYWFEQNTKNYLSKRYFGCNCVKCRSKDFREVYAIQDNYILNFYQNFIPKIQCYNSGEMRRLDKLSNLTQPQIQVVILHHDTDEKYREAFHFPKKGWDIEPTVWSRADILGGVKEEKVLEDKIKDANVVIALISSSFTADDDLWRKHLSKVVSRSKKKEILFIPFQVRPCLWQDAFQEGGENDIPNQIILSRPKDMDWPTDKNWEEATLQIHLIIEKWLKNRLKSDFYFSI